MPRGGSADLSRFGGTDNGVAALSRCDLPDGCVLDMDIDSETFGQVVWNTLTGSPCPDVRVVGAAEPQLRGKLVCACE